MRALSIRSFAKLNLTFEILGLLPGGYHSVRTIFQSVDLADSLTFRLSSINSTEPFRVKLMANVSNDFPLNEDNLIVKAAQRFAQLTGCGGGSELQVNVEKNIPIAAGLAGGSGNAAATLLAMQKFFADHSTQAQTDEVAALLGSDINFCLHGGTQLGTNRGENLESVDNQNELHFIIVKPRDIAISTPWIYRQYDEAQNDGSLGGQPSASLAGAVSDLPDYSSECALALGSGALEKLPGTFYNDFEVVCFKHYPKVMKLRDLMLASGCWSANITGSGPTLFGLVPSLEAGHAVRRKLLASSSPAEQGEFDCWFVQATRAGLMVTEEFA